MQDVSLAALLGRLVISLVVVMALMALAAKAMRGRALGGMRVRKQPAAIEVLGRHPLSRSSSIAVVRAGGRHLVLGVTDNSVRVLAEADPAALEEPEAERTQPRGGNPSPLQPRKSLLDVLREWTVRRS